MANTEHDVRALKARVSGALLARDDVHLVDVTKTPDGDYALHIGVASPDVPSRLPSDLARELEGQPVTYSVVQPFRKQ
jgi:hypothetical protein